MHRKRYTVQEEDTKSKVFIGCAFCPHRLQIPLHTNTKHYAVENGWGWLLKPSKEHSFEEVAICPECLEKLDPGTDFVYIISPREGSK